MRTQTVLRRSVYLSLLLMAPLACGDDDGATGPTPATPSTLEIQPASVGLNAIGDSVRLDAVVRDEDGNALDSVAVSWTNLDPAIATVDTAGLVVAVSTGAARIRASAGELSDEATVVVNQVAASLTLTVPDDTVAEGESVTLEAVVADSNGVEVPGVEVAWTTSDSTAATVDAAGEVTGVWGEAVATITATAGALSEQADILVLGKIVFLSRRTGNGDIYLMNTDGSGVERLTSGDSVDSRPVWAPDGRRIAFASLRDGDWEVYVMNADGGLLQNVTNAPGDTIDSSPAWSPDGSRIAFSSMRDGNFDLYAVNPDGSGLERLTTDVAAEDYPAWSPDGTRIAFTSGRDGNEDIYIMNADGTGTPVQLTETADPIQHSDLDWSPDGTRIAFARSTDINSGVWVMNDDGSDPTDLTTDTNLDGSPRWTPDGDRIVFLSLRDGNAEVYVMNPDGSGQTNLTNDPAADGRGDWRPRPVN